MSEPIKVGDLVYVARDCYGEWIGITFRVKSMGQASLSCGRCPTHFGPINAAWATDCPSIFITPLSWLRKIPPLWELDETEHKEELPA